MCFILGVVALRYKLIFWNSFLVSGHTISTHQTPPEELAVHELHVTPAMYLISTDDTFVSMRYHNIGKRWWDYIETKQVVMVSDMLPPTFSLKSSPIDSLSRLHPTR